MVNQYPGNCLVCGAKVPAKGGDLVKHNGAWRVKHLACAEGKPAVIAVTFSSGQTMTVNSRGRCEDAPCCGCCS